MVFIVRVMAKNDKYFGDIACEMRRSRFEIIAEILKISSVKEGVNVTKIVYKVNLNFKTAQEYITYLIEIGFLEEIDVNDRKRYRTTEKGRDFIRKFDTMDGALL